MESMLNFITTIIFRSLETKPFKFLVSMYVFAFLWALSFTILVNLFFEIEDGVIPEKTLSGFLIAILIIAPILETLIFQFSLQNFLRRSTGNLIGSIFFTALIFAFMHTFVGLHNALYVTGLGVSLGLVYEYFRLRKNNLVAILAVIGFHVFWNAILSSIAIVGWLSGELFV